jgi:hypothetical protein
MFNHARARTRPLAHALSYTHTVREDEKYVAHATCRDLYYVPRKFEENPSKRLITHALAPIYMGYILIMFKHRVHACERACASARVIKRSLIFKRIISKFCGDIQQIPRGYMSYIMCV